MVEARQTEAFAEWHGALRDRRAMQRISDRVLRIAVGNLGDVAPVGEGVTEARIHYGLGTGSISSGAGSS